MKSLDGTATSTITITINGVNDVPVITDAASAVTEDTSPVADNPNTVAVETGAFLVSTGQVTVTDPDAGESTFDTTTLSYGTRTNTGSSGTGQLGTLTVDANGNYSFSVDNTNTQVQALGVGDSIVQTWTVKSLDGTATSTITITINGVNDVPVDGNEVNVVAKNTTLTVAAASGLLVNATDVDGDALSITSYAIAGITATQSVGSPVTIPNVGTLTINADGGYEFTPANNYTGAIPVVTYTLTDGTATDTSTLTLIMSGIVDGNETNTVTEDTTLTVAASAGLLVNASDVDGYAMTITDYTIAGITGTQAVGSPVTIPNVGTLRINADGSYSFAPVLNYTGLIPVVTYTVSNGHGGTDISTLTLTMVPVNDPPVDPNDAHTVIEDTTLTIAANSGLLVGATDPEGDALTITDFTVNGSTYTVGASAPGVANIANVGTLTINADGSYEFTPVANYTGLIPVATYTVIDGHGSSDTSTLTLTMAPVDDIFTDGNERETTPEDTPISGNVIDTSLSSGDGPIRVTTFTIAEVNRTFNAGTTAATIPGVGRITIGTNGAYTFTPLANWNGSVPTITYTLSDGFGVAETSTLDITVTPVNDNPIAVNDRYTMLIDGGEINLTPLTLSADSDPDGDTLSIISIAGTTLTPGTAQTIAVTNGTVGVSAAGEITFTPNTGFTGIVTFPYVISDGHGGTGTANEIIDVISIPVINTEVPVYNFVPTPLPQIAPNRPTENKPAPVSHHNNERFIEKRPLELGQYEFHTVVLNFNGQFGGINQFSTPTVESTLVRDDLEYSNQTPYYHFDRVGDEVKNAQRSVDAKLAVTNDGAFGSHGAKLGSDLVVSALGNKLPEATKFGQPETWSKANANDVKDAKDSRVSVEHAKAAAVVGNVKAGDKDSHASSKTKQSLGKKVGFVGKSSLANQIQTVMSLKTR